MEAENVKECDCPTCPSLKGNMLKWANEASTGGVLFLPTEVQLIEGSIQWNLNMHSSADAQS